MNSSKTFRLFVGVDVSKNSYQIAFLSNEAANSQRWSEIPSQTFTPCRADFQHIRESIARLASPDDTFVIVDHTGGYYAAPLVDFLIAEGCTVGYLAGGPAKELRAKLFVSEDKTDHIDAKTLAYAACLHHSVGLHIRIGRAERFGEDAAFVMLHLSRLRSQLVRQRTRIAGRIDQFVSAAFPEVAGLVGVNINRLVAKYPVPQDIVGHPSLDGLKIPTRLREKLVNLAGVTVGVSTPALRESILFWAHYHQWLDGQVDLIDDRLKGLVEGHPYGPILLSFPAIGVVRAAALVGLIGDIHRWSSSAQLRKMFGFYGTSQQSGMSRRTRKGLGGSHFGKSVLMQAIAGMIRNANEINDFKDCYQRHVDRGVPKLKAMYKAASKLVDVIHHCIRTGQEYRYHRIRLETVQPQGPYSEAVSP